MNELTEFDGDDIKRGRTEAVQAIAQSLTGSIIAMVNQDLPAGPLARATCELARVMAAKVRAKGKSTPARRAESMPRSCRGRRTKQRQRATR